MTILLDTDICIALLRGHRKAAARLVPVTLRRCAVSTVSVYELFIGVFKSDRPDTERMKVEEFLRKVRVVIFDAAAAQRAAQVRAALERTGSSCGPYDLLIAGHALALGLPLATHNVREFSRVDGLPLDDWLA